MDADGAVRGGNVVYLGADAALAAQLRARLPEWVAFAACTGVVNAGRAMQATPASILVLDARIGSPGHDIPKALQQISDGGVAPGVWVCVADPRDLTARLHALRGGARACFDGAGSIDSLYASLLRLIGVTVDSPYKVLVVDDHEVSALFATRVLERAGMQARAVSDALGVLDAMEEMRPDLVLMDLHMPGANGIELTRIIRQHEEFFALPVVFLSGEGDPQRQMDALRVGGNDFLAKPVAVDRLVETVRRRIQSARQSLERGVGAGQREPTTGLWSRDRLLRRIDDAIAGGTPKSAGVGVIYVEIDQARDLDAAPGLLDGAFAEIARELRAAGVSMDLVARVGPTSLGALLHRPDANALIATAEHLRGMVAGQSWTRDGRPLKLTASVGVALLIPAAEDAITMISRAKKACSKARRAGGDRCETYAPSVSDHGSMGRSDYLSGLIREALANDGLRLDYQPVVSLGKRPGERYDALLRLRSADGELISPVDFLPVARECGLMVQIDRWVIGRALDDVLERRDAHPSLQLFIRLSLDTAARSGTVEWLRDEIARRDLIRQRPALVFEVDEVAARVDDAQACFAALRPLGIDVCINRLDDSPRAQRLLFDVAPSVIRLDAGALDQLGLTRLRALVDAAHERGAAVIAPGIEHPQAIARIWGSGVDFIQGNFVQPAGIGLDFDFAGTALV